MIELSQEIIERFQAGLSAATDAGIIEPNAMTVATSDQGRISARTVLMKGFDARGFVFYTNLGSRKARALAGHPYAGLTFLWRDIQQQVVAQGPVEAVSDAEADAYFQSRPRGSRIGAWASIQSTPLDSRETLEQRVARFEAEYPDEVPRPPFWSGYRVRPERIEFWYGQTHRLHDRFVYLPEGDAWQLQRLYP